MSKKHFETTILYYIICMDHLIIIFFLMTLKTANILSNLPWI